MNPKGQHLFEIYTRLSYVRVASYTSHTLPCLNTKQVAVKVISKDQQPLNFYQKFQLTRRLISQNKSHKVKWTYGLYIQI